MAAPALLSNIQTLRAIAAMLVVLAHSVDCAMAHTANGFALVGHLENFGAVGVDLFFVISGFIIAHTAFLGTPRPARRFARQRLVRVVPLYFLLSLPWVLIAAQAGELSLEQSVATILFWPCLNPRVVTFPYLFVGWTLCFEMLFYTAASLALLRPGRLAAIGIGALYLACWLLRQRSGLTVFQFLGNPLIVEFALGMAVAYLAARGPRRFGAVWLVFGVTMLAVTAWVGFGNISEAVPTVDGSLALYRLILWGLPATYIVLAAAVMPPWRPNAVFGPLVGLGAASYSLYLAHPLVLYGYAAALGSVQLHLDGMVVLLGGALLSVAGGVAVYGCIERPMAAWFSRPSAPRRPVQV